MNREGAGSDDGDECLKKGARFRLSCISCDLERGREESGSGAGQSSAGRTSRHEMDYTHSRTKRNNEGREEALVCWHVRATQKDKANLIQEDFCWTEFAQ